MSSLCRLVIVAVAGLGSLHALSGAAHWPGDLFPAPWDLTALSARLQQIAAKGEAIDDLVRGARAASEQKARVVKDLIAGRIDLTEASARYRDLPGPDCRAAIRASFPGRSDEESRRRMIVDHVRHALPGRPGAEGLLARLEEELRSEFGPALAEPPDDSPAEAE